MSMTTVQIQRQIESLNAGDDNARKALLDFAHHRLQALTARIFHSDFHRLRHHEETAGIISELYLRLNRRLEGQQFEDVGHFMRWSACEIRFLLVDMIRRYTGRGNRPEQVSLRVRNDSTSSLGIGEPFEDAQHLLFWYAFHDAIKELPKPDQELVELIWFQNLSQAEVATILGVSISTIKKRWRIARIQIQRALPSNLKNWDSQ